MPEARLARTRRAYALPFWPEWKTATLATTYLEIGGSYFQQVVTVPSHESAKPCGCDPAVHHRCELHASE